MLQKRSNNQRQQQQQQQQRQQQEPVVPNSRSKPWISTKVLLSFIVVLAIIVAFFQILLINAEGDGDDGKSLVHDVRARNNSMDLIDDLEAESHQTLPPPHASYNRTEMTRDDNLLNGGRERARSMSKSSNHEALAAPLAIFYNAFVPASGHVSHVYDIIEEQINQIGNLTSNQVQKGRKTIALHYNTIGRQATDTFVEKKCSAWSHLRCNHLEHYGEGYEMLTERSLLHYCQINPMHTVTYIHPKGSFHAKQEQNSWRFQLTADALNNKCIDPPDRRCNVCGGMFQTAWGPLFLGNMWTAKCSYVKKLIDPFKVEEKYVAAFEAKPDNIEASFYRYGSFSIPRGRYAAEIFIGTHPSIVPCGISHGNQKNETSWLMMPQDKFPANIGAYMKNYQKIVKRGGHRNEWFLLPGLLWRSSFIYNRIPPADSWIWSYYPDGEVWRELLQNVTVREAIETMANYG